MYNKEELETVDYIETKTPDSIKIAKKSVWEWFKTDKRKST